MTSSRPYLVRAIFEWILDNDMTPHLLVDCQNEHVIVPRQHEQDGKIVLNVSPGAVQNLDLGNEAIVFDARFSGESVAIYVPIAYVLAIYTRENGQGMMFNEGDQNTPPPGMDQPDPDQPPPRQSHLKVVK
jgi:stringent starvation protein B